MPQPATTYLGETPVDIRKHPTYRFYTREDWALVWLMRYGQIDGEHHKAWVIDQVARILHGTPVVVTLAKWADGKGTQEYRLDLGEPSQMYKAWVRRSKAGEDGPNTYSYCEGIAP